MKAFSKYLKQTNKEDLQTLSKSDIEQYLLSIGGGTEHRHSICSMLKDFFNFIKLPQNPAQDIIFISQPRKKLFKVPSQLVVVEKMNKFSDKTDWFSLRIRLIAELAYGSGLRREELTRLSIEDINFNDNSLRVNGKGGYIRIVPLTQPAVETLKILLNQKKEYRGPLLTTSTGKRLTPANIYTLCIKHIGIRPHLLRHACATHMLKKGCSIRVIQELLGHKSLTSTQVYTEVLKEDLRVIVETYHPRKHQLNLRSS